MGRLAVSAATLMALSSLAGCANSGGSDNTLGTIGLPQNESARRELVTGLTHVLIERGAASDSDTYVLSSGPVSEREAGELQKALDAIGISTRREAPAETGPHGESLGLLVRAGNYASRAEAEAAADELLKEGISMTVRYTAEDGGNTSGPFVVSLLQVELDRFEGEIISAIGNDKVDGEETVSSMAKRHGAVAATNGGFFAWKLEVGLPGDPAGMLVLNGQLVSEGVNGRPALFIDNSGDNPRVWISHDVRTRISLTLGDVEWRVHGINRLPGMILNCGNAGGGQIELPVHDNLCVNESEILVYDRHFSDYTPPGAGLEFIVDADGTVNSISESTDTLIPLDGFVIRATGGFVEDIRRGLNVGDRASISYAIETEEGNVSLRDGLYAVNGGPTLLRAGEFVLESRADEGWETTFDGVEIANAWGDVNDDLGTEVGATNFRSGFYHGWVVRRHPRTAIGITASNEMIVAVVYGRQPGVSAGASITEMARLLRSLGAVEAMNLDGGGSSSMLVDGELTGMPSDSTGERTVGDGLLFIPRAPMSQ